MSETTAPAIQREGGLTPAQLAVWRPAYRRGYWAKHREFSSAEMLSRENQDACVRAGWAMADAAVDAMGEAK